MEITSNSVTLMRAIFSFFHWVYFFFFMLFSEIVVSMCEPKVCFQRLGSHIIAGLFFLIICLDINYIFGDKI